MYDNYFARLRAVRRNALITAVACTLVIALASCVPLASAQMYDSTSVIRKIGGLTEKLELTTNTSRILTLDKNIPRVQVNNPELLSVTPLSATQVQISAKKAGVTQVNLWDEEGNIHAVDILIYGDARELQVALQTQFPHASIKVFRYSESLVLTGFVDRPDHISPIMALAQDYAPKVINNINVGGVQQVLLKVKVMEISRTELRRLATDWAWLDSNGSFLSLNTGGLLNQTSNIAGNGFQSLTDTSGKAVDFGVVGDDSAFFGFLDWVQQNRVGKILAEPNIMAVSGRPAQFNVGGEIPIVVPQSLGTASIEYKPFGTQIDFLPIVLGNGNIRLEVRPRISEIDDSRSVVIQDFTIPALTVRQVDTAVEMKAGQTFALAGLVQERSDTVKRGIPYLMDMPVLGVPFRRDQDETTETELLILVTPEFVDPMDACEVPCGGPGMFTTQPNDRGLYCNGYVEVPTYCNPTRGLQSCGQDPCGNCNGGNGGCMNGGCAAGGCATGVNGGCNGGSPVVTDGMVMPGGTGYDDGSVVVPDGTPTPAMLPEPQTTTTAPDDIELPGNPGDDRKVDQPTRTPTAPMPPAVNQQGPAPVPPQGPMPNGARLMPQYMPNQPTATVPAVAPGGTTSYAAPRHYSPPRQPVFTRNASNPYNPQPQRTQPAAPARENSLIGGTGYDVQ